MTAHGTDQTGGPVWIDSEHRATLNNGLMTVTIPTRGDEQLFRLELNPNVLFSS